MEPFPGEHKKGRPYTPEQIEWWRKNYPTHPGKDIAKALNMRPNSAAATAKNLGISKDRKYLGKVISNLRKRYFARVSADELRRQVSLQREAHIRTIEHERKLIRLGLEQRTNLQLQGCYSYKHYRWRTKMRKMGYIPGDFRETCGERYCIYYDESTSRDLKAEHCAISCGLRIEPLPKS